MKTKYELKEIINETPLPSAEECYEIRKEKRYIIIDKISKEVIDDAQGYGFKTKEGAWKALYFKLNRNKINESAIKINSWWNNHKELNELLETTMIYDIKDYYQYDEDDRKLIDSNEKYIRLIHNYIKTHNIECDISVIDLFKYRDSSKTIVKRINKIKNKN